MHPFKPNLNLNLNISELHHPKCASNTTNNFDGFVSSLLTADHTCRRSEDEIWEGLLLLLLLLNNKLKFSIPYVIIYLPIDRPHRLMIKHVVSGF